MNARIIAASNIDLAELVTCERFLPDLHARLATFRIVLPPLRERRADIPMLVHESIRRHAPACGYSEAAPQLHDLLLAALQRAPWPNNLRQLDATVHRLLIEADGANCLTLGLCTDDL